MNSYGVAQSDKRVLVQRKTNLNLNTSLAHLVPSHLRDTKAPLCSIDFFSCWLLGCLCGPVIKWAFGRRCQKVVSRGREDTRVWYRETMFSQMVSYEFLLHGALHGYFLYLVCAPPEKPTRRCEPEERYLRCSKLFDHGSNSIIFLLFEFKSVR